MGSPLSPVLADLYMESFETMAIEKAVQPPSLWLRYVDDTFVIWPHGRDTLNDFLSHLNSLAPSIQFTMEIEEGGKLPFLDVLVQRGCDGLTTSVYRKPTHTDHYLDFRSNHHPRIKAGIVKYLAHRARTVCHPNQVKRVFTRNHYPAHLTRGCLTRKKTNTTIDETSNSDTEVTPKILCLPYDLNIKSVFTAKRTLRSLLTRVKSRPDKERVKGVVYKIDCSCGSTYVGETGRTLDARVKEHKRAVRMDHANNGIAVHTNSTLHDIRWDSAEVLEQESNWWKRRYKEALQIRAAKETMNLDAGIQLNPIWSTLNT